jgi:ribosome-interacting GTPase 1
MVNKYSISGVHVITPEKILENSSIAIADRRITQFQKPSTADLKLAGNAFLYPAPINVHDHLRGNYLPKIGPRPGQYYQICHSWEKDLRASPVIAERAKISEEECYYLGAYKNLFSGVVTVNDHYPHEINEKYIDKLPIKVIRNYTLAHEATSYALDWGDGIETEHKRAVAKNHPFIIHMEEGLDDEYQRGVEVLEKLRCLEHMLAVIPKHKGTDKLQADLKRRIAKLTREEAKKGGASRKSSMFNIPREGAGQVVLVGAPNSGKSSVLAGLTNAEPEIAEYPYTTLKPQPGMATFENVRIQLVDLPPVGREFTETWIPGVVRNADLALLVASLASDEVLEETEYVLSRLAEGKVLLVDKVQERFRPDGTAQVKTRLLCTHADHEDAGAVLELMAEVFGPRFPVWSVNATDPASLAALPARLFQELNIVRVYTKGRGKSPDRSDPVLMPAGSTVLDFAREIHKELAQNLKFARIWGKNKFEGGKVPRDYELSDEDVVELHD